MSHSAIIIGSGLGGLECGYILAKHGIKVTVLEKNPQIGGCLQTFRRLGRTFDTGFHYVGGLDEGGPLYYLFRYFSLLDLPWKKLDEDCFDEVVIGDRSYALASGYDSFVKTLTQQFPDQEENLKEYVRTLREVGDNIFKVFDEKTSALNDYFSSSAYEFLQKTITDERLRMVLAGASQKMDLAKNTLPLYIYAQINNSFILGSWRLEGGGEVLARRLADSIISMGGEIRTCAEVTSITENGGKITEVEVNKDYKLNADWVISDVHPAVTLSLVPQTKLIRNIYRQRLSSLKNSYGFFTANICLKKNSLKYRNRNIFIHPSGADLWNSEAGSSNSVMVHFYVPSGEDKTFADCIDLMCPMPYSEVKEWENLPLGRRSKAYEDMKWEKAWECIHTAGTVLPELEDSIEAVFTSTPLTYRDYTGTPDGSAYGICKDFSNPLGTLVSARTPVQNLLLTGQNLNLHGVLGVSMTSVITCSYILGMDTLRQEILGNCK